MKFGAHVSIAGGIQNAPKNAAGLGCEVFQMFTRSPQGGPALRLTTDVVKAFREACDEHQQAAWYVHAPYYINLASVNPAVRASSIRVLREELERASALGASAMMTHLGSAKDRGSEEEALQIAIAGVRQVLDGYRGSAKFLVEISAGAGMVIGDTFEEIAQIVEATKGKVGMCFDTQHAFASGYDLRTPASVREVFDRFENTIGMEHLFASHCNDSKVPFASHKDRHEHIGRGGIGLDGFKAMLSEPRVAKLDFLCETPPDGAAADITALKKLREKVGRGNVSL